MLEHGNSNDFIQEFLEAYPPDQFYRFYVDARKQDGGWKSFENNEPGYLKGVYTAFFTELNFLNEPLTPDLILRIHGNSVAGVRDTNYGDDIPEQSQFRTKENRVGFNLNLGRNLSEAGMQELKKQVEGDFNHFEIKKTIVPAKDNPKRQITSNSTEHKQEDAKPVVDKILAEYHQKMSGEDLSKDNKIQIIVEMISKLERLHPFMDANCRTLCMTLLYRELLKHNIYPPLLDDPNQFDGFSVNELVQKVKEGSQRTEEIIRDNHITTGFRRGVLNERGTQNVLMPDVVDDLTDPKWQLIDYPVSVEKAVEKTKAIEETFEKDKFVHQVIYSESITSLKKDKKINIPADVFLKEMQKNRKHFFVEFVSGEVKANRQFTEMIKYRCVQTVLEILNEINDFDFADDESINKLLSNLLNAHIVAEKYGRKEILNDLNKSMDIILNNMVHNPNQLYGAIKYLYTRNSENEIENQELIILLHKLADKDKIEKLAPQLRNIVEIYKDIGNQKNKIKELRESDQADPSENTRKRIYSFVQHSNLYLGTLGMKCEVKERMGKASLKSYVGQEEVLLRSIFKKTKTGGSSD